MSRARQEKHSEEVRNRILDISRRIISEEGVAALSIRRVTKEMDYSVGIIYHYFESKEEILSCVLREGYKRILNSIPPTGSDLAPDEAISAAIKGYIEAAMSWPFEYKAVMLDSSPQVLEVTSVLGGLENRPALAALVSTLEAGISDGLFAPCDTTLTAQAIWGAMFGLLIRLIIEGAVPPEQQSLLIDRQTEIILKGLRP